MEWNIQYYWICRYPLTLSSCHITDYLLYFHCNHRSQVGGKALILLACTKLGIIIFIIIILALSFSGHWSMQKREWKLLIKATYLVKNIKGYWVIHVVNNYSKDWTLSWSYSTLTNSSSTYGSICCLYSSYCLQDSLSSLFAKKKERKKK